MTLSPLNQRRLANFRANKRGYWSLWIFLALFAVTLCAELVANDKPLVYVPRMDFREALLLEEAIRRYLRQARISQQDLYAGRWQEAILAALRVPRPGESLPVAGAGQIAQRILSFL